MTGQIDAGGDGRRELADVFPWSIPLDLIGQALDAADGNEVASGKIFSPRSSSALALNAFGPFFAPTRAGRLPPLPGIDVPWQDVSVRPEAKLPFPWSRGRRPNIDILIETATAVVAIECKRREPFDAKGARPWQDAYLTHDWGPGMQRYCALRDGPERRFSYLDSGQLVRHAFGLWTATQFGQFAAGKTPVLFYLYATPGDVALDLRAHHADEVAAFSRAVEGDVVRFGSCSYADLLRNWDHEQDRHLRAHAATMRALFSDAL